MERCLTNASIFQGNRSHKRIRTVADILPDGISQTHPVSGFSLSRAHPGLTLADDGIQRFFGLFRRLAYHRVSRGLYRNICPCRRRNEYIMNGRFSYKKYGDKPCQKWACLRSFFGMRLCVPACNIKWHSRGKGFDPPHLHHKQPASVWMRAVFMWTALSGGNKKYMNMKHLEAALEDDPIAG